LKEKKGNGEAYAHGPNRSGTPHQLCDHLKKVAELCGQYADDFGFSRSGYLLGYWHDIGKIHPKWQTYLRESEEAVKTGRKVKGPYHAPVGVCRSRDLWPLAMAIAAHHTHLRSIADFQNKLFGYSDSELFKEGLKLWLKSEPSDLGRLIESAKQEMIVIQNAAQSADTKKRKEKQISRLEFVIRFLLSALVDADRLDTEAHFKPWKGELRTVKPTLEDMQGKLQEELDRLTRNAVDSEVNRVRGEVLAACIKSAESETGIFRLTAPTGAGKTLSSLAFALRHAILHNLHRIVVAIPYTSIIDQTAQTCRKIFGPEGVLEHHSAIRELKHTTDELEDKLRLATENWDYPLIVTTTNQLFESLFSNHPSRVRKIHNLARSVIIIDEVQTLPIELLEPTLEAIRQLTDHYGATVLLSTATQPAIVGHMEGLENVHEILPNAATHFDELRRVEYQWPEGKQSWVEIAEKMLEFEQVLTVVNMKKNAIQLLDALGDNTALHLSTLLCGAHRREVLDEINRRLKNGEPCRVVSTQVVEAGVDLDFPVVMRAIGPLDRIVQVAGRCNREGKLAGLGRVGKLAGLGRVIIFDPEEGKVPSGSYRTGTDEARLLIAEGKLDPDNPYTFERYFSRLYQGVELDKHGIEKKRQHLNYPEVAEKYRFIPHETIPVVVSTWQPDKDKVNKILDSIRGKLASGSGPSRDDFRKLQPYIVNLYPYQYQECADWIDESIDGIHKWTGPYDSVRGLITESIKSEDLLW